VVAMPSERQRGQFLGIARSSGSTHHNLTRMQAVKMCVKKEECALVRRRGQTKQIATDDPDFHENTTELGELRGHEVQSTSTDSNK